MRAEARTAVADRPGPWLVALNGLVAALLVLTVVKPLGESRRVHLETAADNTRNIARTLAQTLDSDLQRIDLALLALVAAGPTGAAARREPVAASMRQARSLHLADANGLVLRGAADAAAGPGSGSNVAARDFFAAARGQAPGAAAPVVSEPEQAAPNGPWAIVMARALHDERGAFAGVAFATVPVASLAQRFEGIDVGRDGAITLRSANLALIARVTAQGLGSAGIGSTQVSSELQALLRREPDAGAYVAVVPFDGIQRANAYQRVGNSPLRVFVGQGTDEFLAPWRQQALQTAVLASLLMAAVVAASWLGHGAWRAQAAARQRLGAELQRQQVLLSTASDGIHILSGDGRLLEFNDAFARLLGRPRRELEGAYIGSWDTGHPIATLQAWLSSFEPAERRRTLSRWRCADGSEIDVEITSAALRLDGQPVVHCAARDITANRRLQATLRAAGEQAERSERFLQEITDNVPLRIAYVDAEGRYRFVNRAHLERFDRPREQVLGRTRGELTGSPTPVPIQAELQAALAGQARRFEFEETVRGERVVVESRLVPDIGPAGEVRGLYTVGSDVTERHTQQRRIEAALAERETLLREVYHRVKNNLQVVHSLLNLQQRTLADGAAREALRECAERVRAMALVHEQLYQSDSLAAIGLAHYTQELLRHLAQSSGARQRGVALVAEVEDVQAALDKAMPYAMLVAELVGNSLKHAFENRGSGNGAGHGAGHGDGGTVWVRLAQPTPGEPPVLTVQDDGRGLAAGFEIGHQATLGLQLAASLAAQLGGKLEAVPSARGSTFRAVLSALHGLESPA